MWPTVTIVVLNYNGAELTKKCVASLKKLDYPKNKHDILIVENGSEDNSLEELRKLKGVKLLALPKNRGFTGGHNAGVKAAKGKYVLMLNNDVIVPKDMVKKMISAMEKDKSIGIAGPVVRNQGDFYRKITFSNSLGTLFFYTLPQKNKAETETYSAGGVAMLIRKEEVPKPFDEFYYCYHEDVHLMLSTFFRGKKPFIVQDTYLNHIGGIARKKNPSLAYYEERNKFLTFFMFYSPGTILKLLPLLALDSMLVLGLSLFNQAFFSRLKAQLWVPFNIPLILKKRKQVQSGRKISEKELFHHLSYRSHHSPKFVGDIMSDIQYVYCKVFRLPVYEFRKNGQRT